MSDPVNIYLVKKLEQAERDKDNLYEAMARQDSYAESTRSWLERICKCYKAIPNKDGSKAIAWAIGFTMSCDEWEEVKKLIGPKFLSKD